MANLLKMAEVHAIQTLRERGWSYRRIARELGMHRETVSRYLRASPSGLQSGAGGEQNRPNPPAGSGAEDGSNLPAGCSGPPSRCEPWRQQIMAGLERGLSAQRIWQDLCQQSGFDGAYDSVKRFCRRLTQAQSLPFRRMECAAGAEVQVDFGRGAPVVDQDPATGRPRRRVPHVLRVVLSCSRKGFSQVVERQTTENFIRGLEDAFHHFGGVPATLVLDNLKAAVSKADWFDPELNPKVQSFCAHYGIAALPTKPRTPRHKGKVERGVAYVQDNALKGRQFASLEEQNRHLAHWEATVADTRIHGTTRKQVKELFDQVEKPALKPLPAERFPFFREGQRTVHRDGHVEVDKAYYSVPPEYLGRPVWVRWDSRLVRVFDPRMQLIATHVRKEEGQFSTQDRHILDQKITGVERGAAWLLQRAGIIGLKAQRWAEAMVQARGIEGVRVLQGFLSLADKHPHAQVNEACGLALDHQAWRLRTLRRLLAHDPHRADQQQDLLEEHPIIRSLADYGQLVHNSFLQPLETAL